MKTLFRFLILLLLCILFATVSEANYIGSSMFGCACGLIFYLLEHYER